MILVANNEGWPGVACTSQALAAGARAIDDMPPVCNIINILSNKVNWFSSSHMTQS